MTLDGTRPDGSSLYAVYGLDLALCSDAHRGRGARGRAACIPDCQRFAADSIAARVWCGR